MDPSFTGLWNSRFQEMVQFKDRPWNIIKGVGRRRGR